MVFTVEPGVYMKELGGFRHSDTVVVTEDGCRVMTDYPRELKELIVASN
jgi:Xaa-Pro aminopeptidase